VHAPARAARACEMWHTALRANLVRHDASEQTRELPPLVLQPWLQARRVQSPSIQTCESSQPAPDRLPGSCCCAHLSRATGSVMFSTGRPDLRTDFAFWGYDIQPNWAESSPIFCKWGHVVWDFFNRLSSVSMLSFWESSRLCAISLTLSVAALVCLHIFAALAVQT
jgi:hypothetical protein